MGFYYEVTNVDGRKIHVLAKNSQEAKRIACRLLGKKASDYWTGISSMKAKRIRKDEC